MLARATAAPDRDLLEQTAVIDDRARTIDPAPDSAASPPETGDPNRSVS
jgi:hypothetical protein